MHLQALQAFPTSILGIEGFYGDCSWRHFLGNQNRKSLLPLLRPVIQIREDRVLVIEIIVENRNDGGLEEKLLRERFSAIDLQVYSSRAIFRNRDRGPFVMQWSAVTAQLQRGSYMRFRALRCFHN